MPTPTSLLALVSGLALAALVGGCASAPPPPSGPAAPTAAAPAPTPAARPATATVFGSEESSALLDNFTAFVTAVDGQPVAAGRRGWNLPLILPEGPHVLAVEFNRGLFQARAELPLHARAYRTYEVRHASDVQMFGQNSHCDFWIVDRATGEIVTPRQRARVISLKPPP
ncbi:MAG: hypothetical protein JNG83_10920 [Opitutaceae bacterium]|nr:hypothetical protein [Opitutaceae bacterium]